MQTDTSNDQSDGTPTPVRATAAPMAGMTFTGTTGNDSFTGTAGDDYFDLSQGGSDFARGGDGNDGFYFGTQLDPYDNLDGGAGNNDQIAVQGNVTDTLSRINLIGIETIAVLSGHDARFGDTAGNDYNYNLSMGANATQYLSTTTVNANNLQANESLTFNGSAVAGSLIFYAGLGNDTLIGSGGGDGFFFGDSGRLTAADHVDGGGSTLDQLAIRGDYSALTVFGPDTVQNVETIALISYTDTRHATGGGPFHYNFKFNDAMIPRWDGHGAAPQEYITINANNLQSNESARIDASDESNGFFFYYGGAGDDTFIGGARQDYITPGRGHDVLTGGGGSDIFYFHSIYDSTVGPDRDQITDFSGSRSNDDSLNLSGIDANPSTPGIDHFFFLGTDPFTHHAGESRIYGSGSDWVFQVDTNGDAFADMEIGLTTTDGYIPHAEDFG